MEVQNTEGRAVFALVAPLDERPLPVAVRLEPDVIVTDGFTAGMAWDAFDNLHEHDGVWALYGLLETHRDLANRPRVVSGRK